MFNHISWTCQHLHSPIAPGKCQLWSKNHFVTGSLGKVIDFCDWNSVWTMKFMLNDNIIIQDPTDININRKWSCTAIRSDIDYRLTDTFIASARRQMDCKVSLARRTLSVLAHYVRHTYFAIIINSIRWYWFTHYISPGLVWRLQQMYPWNMISNGSFQ